MFRMAISALVVLLIVTIAGCTRQETKKPKKAAELTAKEKEMGIKLTPKGVKYLVDPDKIVSGGPPKDGIPSIDQPKFVSVKEADEWIEDDELVLAMTYKKTERVYPLQIMVWHEIVNDVIAGDPILVTY